MTGTVPNRLPHAAFGVCVASVFLALIVSGVMVGETLLFVCYELAFPLLSGLILLALLSQRPRPLADTLAIALPLGLATEIGSFVLTAAVGERWLFAFYPAILVVAVAPLLWMRRTELTSSRLALSRSATDPKLVLAVLLTAVAATLVVSLNLFAPSPLPRDARSVSYYPDLMFHLSLAAEILHHWPFADPNVSGQPLHYHIFANVDMAAVAQVTRLDLATILMRLQPVALISLIGVQLFTLGRKVGCSGAAGVAALVLGLLAGELNFSTYNMFGGDTSALGLLYSPSYELGAVFFLGILFVLIEHPTPAPFESRRYWTMLAILSLGAIGAKSAVVPILVGGLALFAIGRAVAHSDSISDDVRRLAIILAVGVAGYVVLYRGGGQGIIFKPLDFIGYSRFAPLYRHANDSLTHSAEAGGAAVVVLCGLLLGLGGTALIRSRWWPRERNSSPERLLMCMFAASLPPFLLLGVPGNSETYFVVYGFLAAVIVSAVAVVGVVDKLRLGSARLVCPGAVCATGVVVAILSLRASSSAGALLLAYALLTCTVAAAVWLLHRRVPTAIAMPHRSYLALGAVVSVGMTTISGPYQLIDRAIGRLLRGSTMTQASGTVTNRGLTAGLWRGLMWVRAHTRSSDVIAVNNHYREYGADSRYFYYSAIAERRVFLQSWEYTKLGYEYLSRGLSTTPYPGLLALNEAAVVEGSLKAIRTLYSRYGVRYIVIDRLHGPASSNLPRLTRLVFANPDVAVFRIV